MSARRSTSAAPSPSSTTTAVRPAATASWPDTLAYPPALLSGSVRLVRRGQQGPVVAHVRGLLRPARGWPGRLQRLVQRGLRGGRVYVPAQLALPGQDGDTVVGHGQEPARYGREHVGLARIVHPDLHGAALGQDADDRRMVGQQADLAIQGPGDDHLGLAGPDLTLRLDQLYVHHDRAPRRDSVTTAPCPWPSSPRPRSRRT